MLAFTISKWSSLDGQELSFTVDCYWIAQAVEWPHLSGLIVL